MVVLRKMHGDMKTASSYFLFPVYGKYDPQEQQKLCEATTNDAEPKPLLKARQIWLMRVWDLFM
jgi:hypothetical protein